MMTIAQATEWLNTHLKAGERAWSTQTVGNLCRRHGIGTLLTPRLRVLTVGEVKRLRVIRPPMGNPNWGKKSTKGGKKRG